MQNYVKTYLERDILRLFPNLQREKYQLFLQMLAQLSRTIINYSNVARTLDLSEPTVRDYFRIAHGTFSNNDRLGLIDEKLINIPFGYV